ncbi:MAG: hypothetical protein HY822_05760 [Acidobacteria bacterium]|nr:hypothetical protein [Acidobacteriota bacterium]
MAVRESKPKTPRDDASSGDVQVALPALEPGSRIEKAALRVAGRGFHGKLKDLKGAVVTASPVTRTPAVIVDFGAPRSILSLALGSAGKIREVSAWLGTEFASKPAYSGDASSASFAGLETPKLLVKAVTSGGQAFTAAAFAASCRITTATGPSNVRASLNGGLPFWTHPGVLSAEVAVTGLVESLNALAKDAAAPVSPVVSLVTDTPGVIETSFSAAQDWSVLRCSAARWGAESKLELALVALEPQTVVVPFPAPGASARSQCRVSLVLAGAFPPWRAFPAQSGGAGKLGMKVGSRFTVARRFEFAEAGELHGLALLLRTGGEKTELRLELLVDAGDRPGPGKPLAFALLALAAASDAPAWTDVLFPQPVKVAAPASLWCVLKAKTGAVEWAGVAGQQANTLFSDEGSLWQSYPALGGGTAPSARMRVLRKPFPKETAPLLTIEKVATDLEGAATLELEIKAPLAVQGGTVSVPLCFQAAASGKLTLKSATAFYKAQGGPA